MYDNIVLYLHHWLLDGSTRVNYIHFNGTNNFIYLKRGIYYEDQRKNGGT